MTTIKDYCLAMNVAYMVNQFDGGQTWTFSRDGVTWSGSFDWGGEDAFFAAVTKWLDSLPWPTEDDPRVQMQGTYTDRRA